MARNEQLVRQHKILQILERVRYGYLLEEIRDALVEELGLSSLHTRTVRRDIESLQQAGLDIDVHDSGRGRVWKLGPNARGTHKITASATELIALSLGRDLLLPLSGTPFWLGIESFWTKIREQLPEATWEHYRKFRQVLHVTGFAAKNYSAKEGILKNLNRAIHQHRVVDVSYQKTGQPSASQRKLEPYGIVFHQGSIYIVAAACELPEEDPNRLRHWKLDRFKKAEVTDQYFKLPADFDLEKHLGGSIGIFAAKEPRDFVIRVSANAVGWVTEDPWHPEQKVEPQQDGSILLTVKAAHDLEIIPRVLALGPAAEVVSPLSTRQAIKQRLMEMAQVYEENKDPPVQ